MGVDQSKPTVQIIQTRDNSTSTDWRDVDPLRETDNIAEMNRILGWRKYRVRTKTEMDGEDA